MQEITAKLPQIAQFERIKIPLVRRVYEGVDYKNSPYWSTIRFPLHRSEVKAKNEVVIE